jgi:large subunit ribosomal protein L8e
LKVHHYLRLTKIYLHIQKVLPLKIIYLGQHIFCGKKAQINVGNILPLNAMPEGSSV